MVTDGTVVRGEDRPVVGPITCRPELDRLASYLLFLFTDLALRNPNFINPFQLSVNNPSSLGTSLTVSATSRSGC